MEQKIPQHVAEPVSDAELIPILFIPGYQGSSLKRKGSNKTTYLTLSQVTGDFCFCCCRKDDISLPTEWTESKGSFVQGESVDEAGPPLDRFKVLCIKVDVYSPLLEWGEATQRHFYSFGYDWRRSNHETLQLCIQRIKKISSDHNGAKVQIVAHSMGGFITMGLLQHCPELVHSIVFAGTPFGSGLRYLEDLQRGTSVGLNTTLLSAETLWTFPSEFQFFPRSVEEGEQYNTSLRNTDGQIVDCDFYNADDWERYRLGLYALDRQVSGELKEHLKHALQAAKSYKEQYMVYREDIEYPPIAVLAADTLDCSADVIIGGPKSQSPSGLDFESAPKVKGDGSVGFDRAIPFDGIPYKLFKPRTKFEHTQLVNDPDLIEEITNSLLDENYQMEEKQND